MQSAGHLKQAEIFAFLALVFLIAYVLVEQEPEPPPILVLSEEDESYQFPSGTADVEERFLQALEDRIVPQLDSMMATCACDVIEVVGHTDRLEVGRRSNLDAGLVAAYRDRDVSTLRPGSNVDLGMMRAVAVIALLRDAQVGGQLGGIDYFFPYSAGEMVLPDNSLDTATEEVDDPSRRRIEIRLRRSEGRLAEGAQESGA